MSSPTDSDNPPHRADQRLLKPSTLPPGVALDEAVCGENVGPYKPLLRTTPTPSATELIQTFPQSPSQTQIFIRDNDGGRTSILLIALRITFYLGVIALAIALSLTACKFTNFWDPCEHLYINTTHCKVTSYFKGMVYHTDCTEEHYCILPGFQSNIKRQEWSLLKPNDTLIQSTEYNQTVEQVSS